MSGAQSSVAVQGCEAKKESSEAKRSGGVFFGRRSSAGHMIELLKAGNAIVADEKALIDERLMLTGSPIRCRIR